MNYDDLVGRLHDHARNFGGDDSFDRLYGDEAARSATAITTLSARVRELEGRCGRLQATVLVPGAIRN